MYTLALNYQTAFEMQDISYLLNPVSNIFESSENTVRFCLISAHRKTNMMRGPMIAGGKKAKIV